MEFRTSKRDLSIGLACIGIFSLVLGLGFGLKRPSTIPSDPVVSETDLMTDQTKMVAMTKSSTRSIRETSGYLKEDEMDPSKSMDPGKDNVEDSPEPMNQDEDRQDLNYSEASRSQHDEGDSESGYQSENEEDSSGAEEEVLFEKLTPILAMVPESPMDRALRVLKDHPVVDG